MAYSKQQQQVLEYRSMEATKLLAERSQFSAENMEDLTRDMGELARETKEETVSMRIITLVTLFYLPGTFISVSEVFPLLRQTYGGVQTIMSTDIVRFQPTRKGKTQKTFQQGALQLYLAITVPLMLFTFAAWYAVKWRASQRKSREVDEEASH